MQELEKILEEIEKEAMNNPEVGRKQYEGMMRAMNIIRKHMNDGNCGECSRRKWYLKGYEDRKDADVIDKILLEMQEVKEIVLSPKGGDCFGEPCDGDDCLLCIVDKCIEIAQKHANDGWIPVEERLPEEKVNHITKDFYEYQVTAKFGNVTDVRHYKFGNGHWWNGPGIVDEYVIAWKENAEPYSLERRNMCTVNI